MNYKVIGLTLAVLLASGSAVFANVGPWGGYQAVVHHRLAELGIPATDIKGINYVRQVATRREDDHVTGVNAWVDLKSCPGSVVVNLNTSGQVRQVYTRYGCHIKGIEHY